MSACISQSGNIQRIPSHDNAHQVGDQRPDIPLLVRQSHGHVLIRHLRRQLILQAVDVNEDAVQLFFVGLELFKAFQRDPFPLMICGFQTDAQFSSGSHLFSVLRYDDSCGFAFFHLHVFN